jgi:iron complex outermembrane receptor protein
MKNKVFSKQKTATIFAIWLPSLLLCQSVFVTGSVKDFYSSEPLFGVTILVNDVKVGGTDLNGQFKVEVDAKTLPVTISTDYVGYRPESKKVSFGNSPIEIKIQQGYELSEIVISGVKARSKENSAVPVSTIHMDEIYTKAGQLDLNQLLMYASSSFQSVRQTIADGTDHIDPANLRGMGSDQVLVLLNGKRLHQSALVNVNGTVNRGTVSTDLSMVPAASIEKIEVLSDGAASQFGSDAIAGVINIKTKEVSKSGVSISYGNNSTRYDKNYIFNIDNNILNNNQSKYKVNDGRNINVGVNASIGKIQGSFLNVTYEYLSRGSTNRTGLYTGQLYPSQNGFIKDDSILIAKKITRDFFDMQIGNSQINSHSVLVNSQLEIIDQWKIYGLGLINLKRGMAAGFYRYPYQIPTISNGILKYPDGFLPEIATNIFDLNFTIGTKFEFGDWRNDLSFTTGQNKFSFDAKNSINYTQSYSQPGTFQTEFDCGNLDFKQSTINYNVKKQFEDLLYGGNLKLGAEYRIDKFSQNAGEEASYKNYTPTLSLVPGAQVFPGFQPKDEIYPTRTNKSIFVDYEQDFTDYFLLGGAIRFENYSDFGNALTGKLAGRLALFNKSWFIRGSASTGYRAPSLQQRYYSKTNTTFLSTTSGLQPVETGTFKNDSPLAKAYGIPELKEERSTNFTLGTTIKPGIEGLMLNVDGYFIKVQDRIILTNNFNKGDGSNSSLNALIDQQNVGAANFFANAINTNSKGFESSLHYTKYWRKSYLSFDLSWAHMINEVKLDNKGDVALNATEVLKSTGQLSNYFNREDLNRIEWGNPREKLSFTINCKTLRLRNKNELSFMLRNTYWGVVKYADPVDANLDQTFSGKIITDLSITLKIKQGVKITLGGNNIRDIYPDNHINADNFSYGRFVYSRRVQQFGFNGRYVFASVGYVLDNK